MGEKPTVKLYTSYIKQHVGTVHQNSNKGKEGTRWIQVRIIYHVVLGLGLGSSIGNGELESIVEHTVLSGI